MIGYLRALGVFVLLVGLLTAGVAGLRLAGDEHFREVAEAYARHPEHALFQAEYWAAAVRHYGLLTAAVVGLLGGLVLGGLLLGLAEVLRSVRDLVSDRGRTARVPPGEHGGQRAAAGEAGAADLPDREPMR